MTQILLYQSPLGIMLATDSRAVKLGPEEGKEYTTIQKIFVLNPRVVLATGGAGYGVLLCEKFKNYVQAAGLADYEDILHIAVVFLQQQLKQIHHPTSYVPDHPDLERVYFLLAGHTPEEPQHPFSFELLAAENLEDPLHPIEVGKAVAIPRQLGLEFRLSRIAATGNELQEAELICESFLIKLCKESLDVGPPLHFALLTASGLKIRTIEAIAPETSVSLRGGHNET
jgi:hypothetical protein